MPKGQSDTIAKDLAANFSHSTVSGIFSYPVFGIEGGLVLGATQVSGLSSIIPNLKYVPMAGASIVFSMPLGIAFEALLLPTVEREGIRFSNYSGMVRWNVLEVFNVPVFGLGPRVSYTSTSAAIALGSLGVGGTASFESDTLGVDVLAAVKFLAVEAYAGVGYYQSHGQTGISLGGIRGVQLPALMHNHDVNGFKYIAGIEAKLLIISVGVEYQGAFDTARVLAKLSLDIGF